MKQSRPVCVPLSPLAGCPRLRTWLLQTFCCPTFCILSPDDNPSSRTYRHRMATHRCRPDQLQHPAHLLQQPKIGARSARRCPFVAASVHLFRQDHYALSPHITAPKPPTKLHNMTQGNLCRGPCAFPCIHPLTLTWCPAALDQCSSWCDP